MGNNGEALARVAGARRLDRGVEDQQVGLSGGAVDQAHHLADLIRRMYELAIVSLVRSASFPAGWRSGWSC
ncbi:hypothetical protein GGE65_008140 [Skermanella aerolata]